MFLLAKICVCNKNKISSVYSHYKYKYYTSSMEKIDINDIDGILNSNQDYYIYIGSPKCPSCISLIDNVRFIIDNNSINKVYYLSLDISMDFSDDRIDKIFEEYSLDTIPALIMKDGVNVVGFTTNDIRNFE